MKAKTVRDVVLGEAKAGDVDDMEHIASVIANRARELGISEQDVVSSGEFDAYGKSLPAGVARFAKQAEAALAKVAKDGPVTNATYYATPDKVGNLGRKVTKTGMVAKTKGHQYYAAPLKAGVPLGQTVAPQVAAPPSGLGAFFSDPLGMQASAAEAPSGGLLGTPASAKQQAQIDYFGSVPTTDWSQQREEAVRQREAKPALSAPAFDERFGAPALSAPSFDARFGAPAAPDAQRFAPDIASVQGPVSPETYAEARQPASTNARAAFDAIAAGLNAPGISSQPASLGSQIGAMAAPQEPGMITDAKGTFADPFGTMKPGGVANVQKAQTEQMPSEAMAYAEQPGSVPTQAQRDSVAVSPGLVGALDAPKSVKDYAVASAAPAATPPDLGMKDGRHIAGFNLNNALEAMRNIPQSPTIADPNSEVGPQGQTIAGDFPAAPSATPRMDRFKEALAPALTGGLLGGLPGAAIGLARGLLGGQSGGLLGNLGPGFDAAVPSHDRFSTGSGLHGIMSAMGGERGAQGFSRSNPGQSYTSLGPGMGGLRRSDKYGWTEHVDPSGSVTGISYDNGGGGLLGGISRGLGSLFGGSDKDKGKSGMSKAGKNSISKGKGGLY